MGVLLSHMLPCSFSTESFQEAENNCFFVYILLCLSLYNHNVSYQLIVKGPTALRQDRLIKSTSCKTLTTLKLLNSY